MTTINYLAYGSNLFPARLRERIAVHGIAGMVTLADTALAFNKRGADGSGKCTLHARPGECAYGVVYRIETSDKAILDRIEGVGHGYAVECWQDAALGECFFYRAQAAALDDSLSPFDWYHAYVLHGARHHGFPADYLAAIAAVRTVTDPDINRRTENFARLSRRR